MKTTIRLSKFLLFALLIFVNTGHTDPDKSKAEAANAALKASLDLGYPDSYSIKTKLQSGDYEALEELLQKGVQLYKHDALYESYLQKGFDLFKAENGVSDADIDAWVAATGSGIAYAARGIFKAQQGFTVRGKKPAKRTPSENLERMRQLHVEAAADLELAISKHPSLQPAYGWMIQITKASNLHFSAREILQKAVAADSRTYYTRFQYMTAMSPLWCGSMDSMIAYAMEIETTPTTNPRVWSIQGEVFAEIADFFYQDRAFVKAAELYTAALQFGDRTTTLKWRAACYYNLGQFKESIDDLDRALYYNPNDEIARQRLEQSKIALANR